MDSKKFYCRNATSVTSSTSSPGVNGTCTSTTQEYDSCDPNSSAAESNCKESIAINNNNGSGKSSYNMRVDNCNAGYSSIVSNITNGCHSNSSNRFGSYINGTSVPTGTLQYHRQKLIPQEYQSRLYNNTDDYRCRDEYFSAGNVTVGSNAGGGVRMNSESLSPSAQLQGQEQQIQKQNNHQSQHLQLQHHHHHHQMSQQASQHPYHHYSQQEETNSPGGNRESHKQQHKNMCSPTSGSDIDEKISCSLVLGNGRMAAATQTHHKNSCDQLISPTSMAVNSLQTQVPPIMYTVHRVVTTAQIQTAGGNTFTSTSSVSSVVSAVRSESDCIGNVLTPVSKSQNAGCFVAGDISDCGAHIMADGNSNCNVTAGQSNLQNSPGLNTNTNTYLTNQSKVGGSTDLPRITNVLQSSLAPASACTYTTEVKAPSISRPLQNVIPTCVYLMSRIAVHMEIEGTVQCPSQVMLAAALGCEELGIANKLLAQSIFGLWMTSALLEIQLKSHHRPYVVRVAWPNLLEKFSHGNPIEKKYDEPMIILKRNVFLSKRDEEKIKDHRILELLYEEAKQNVLTGRYIMESVHSLMLGGIQARIELGPFNSNSHTISFFRENQSRFLPQHVAKNSSWSWLPLSRKNSAEVRLLDQFKRVPQTATTRKLMRKYLEFCWALPFYGAAFFSWTGRATCTWSDEFSKSQGRHSFNCRE